MPGCSTACPLCMGAQAQCPPTPAPSWPCAYSCVPAWPSLPRLSCLMSSSQHLGSVAIWHPHLAQFILLSLFLLPVTHAAECSMRTRNSPASAGPSVMLGRPSSPPQSPQRPPQPLFDFFLMCDPALPPSSSAADLAFLHRGQSSLPATIPGSLLLRWPSGLSVLFQLCREVFPTYTNKLPLQPLSPSPSSWHCCSPALYRRASGSSSHPAAPWCAPPLTPIPVSAQTVRGVWSPRTFLSQNPMCTFQFFFSLTSQVFGSPVLFPFQNLLFLFFFFL